MCRRLGREEISHDLLRPGLRRDCWRDSLAGHAVFYQLSGRGVDRVLRQHGPHGEIVEDIGMHGPGTQVDNLDLEGRELDAQVVGQHRRGGFGRVVDALHRHRRDGHDGCVVDDHGAAGGLEE